MTVERSPSGTARTLDAPVMTFDLPAMLVQLKRERTWKTANRNAMTLLKARRLRLVLVIMHTGSIIPLHRSDGPITVQVLAGRLVFSAGSRDARLGPGQLVSLAPNVPHGLEALDECAFLLTIGAEGGHPAEARARRNS
jgi:quercetin dioxygenase-like cupin family protein